ncbi:hypothetical protein ONE63_009723 [Megalurothrips usitatus]|uniref:Major facilitator superfamily (MFS) profile domain-containing protein n=1 Tax=Megalurothrips usitatus TaxID=439358 RepID=A0AAV7XJN2_9NEOP|nr:hypothetical protein ONE63_009723 [Megalurothrips usitatus]
MCLQSTEKTPLLGPSSAKEAMEGAKGTQYMGALAACMSAMAVGTTMGWTSAAGILTADRTAPEDFRTSKDDFSWVSAFLSIGAIIGAIPLGILANLIGRKKVLLFLAPFMVIAYLLLAWANSVWMLYLARFILGAVTGAYCVVAPMYTGEIAEASIRGVLGSYFQLLITGGILFVYVLAALELDLFWVNIACACIPAVMAAMVSFFPDTPRWYLSKGQTDSAKSSLRFFRGSSYDVDREIQEIQTSLDEEAAAKLPITEAFSTTAAKKGLFLALSVMIFQQFSGINAVIFFSAQIFEAAHSTLKPSVATVVVGCCQIVATYVSTLLIDRLGRRILLILSGLSMALSGAVLGVYFYLDLLKDVDIGWLPILCMVVFIVMFSLGYGPIPWLYMSEVFSAQIKETAMSIATVMNWASVFVVTKFYDQLSTAIGNYSTFWIFSAISITGCFFTFFFVIETKGKAFEQILRELGGSTPSNGTVQASDTVYTNCKKVDAEKY